MEPEPSILERVVIVGKTRMGGGVCIGGIVERTGKPVRLLPIGRPCHPPQVSFEIGEIWEMSLRPRAVLDAPHMEDHDEWSARKIGAAQDLSSFIARVARVQRGEATSLFGGMLRFRKSGSGFLPRNVPSPTWSVEFWKLPRPLRLDPTEPRPRYVMFKPFRFGVPFVGFDTPIGILPAGTLVRMSMARWWINPQAPEEGETCSLQLSGWFDATPTPSN